MPWYLCFPSASCESEMLSKTFSLLVQNNWFNQCCQNLCDVPSDLCFWRVKPYQVWTWHSEAMRRHESSSQSANRSETDGQPVTQREEEERVRLERNWPLCWFVHPQQEHRCKNHYFCCFRLIILNFHIYSIFILYFHHFYFICVLWYLTTCVWPGLDTLVLPAFLPQNFAPPPHL